LASKVSGNRLRAEGASAACATEVTPKADARRADAIIEYRERSMVVLSRAEERLVAAAGLRGPCRPRGRAGRAPGPTPRRRRPALPADLADGRTILPVDARRAPVRARDQGDSRSG
jgi:hypothetical protein